MTDDRMREIIKEYGLDNSSQVRKMCYQIISEVEQEKCEMCEQKIRYREMLKDIYAAGHPDKELWEKVGVILNPTEEVVDELVRWECPHCEAIYTDVKFSNHSVCGFKGEMIELRGTRPIRKKIVQHREKINPDKYPFAYQNTIPTSAKYYAEWTTEE